MAMRSSTSTVGLDGLPLGRVGRRPMAPAVFGWRRVAAVTGFQLPLQSMEVIAGPADGRLRVCLIGRCVARRVLLLAVLLAVACGVELVAASGASAAFVAPGTGACVAESPPAGETGGYYWVGSDGTCSANWISQDQFASLVDRDVAAADEATGASIPADISSADTAAGTAVWDSLGSVGSDLKSPAMDFLVGDDSWLTFAGLPELGLGVGAFEVGWKLGSAVEDLLGVDKGPPTTGSSYVAVGVTPVVQGTDLESLTQSCAYQPAFPTCVDEHPKAPADGYIVMFDRNDQYGYNFAYECRASPGFVPPSQLPSNASLVVVEENVGGCTDDNLATLDAYFVPATITALPGQGQTVPNTISEVGPSPSEAQQKSAASTMLQNNDFDGFTQYACALMGASGPCPFWVAVPMPTTHETEADYVARLSQEGLVANTVTLQPSAAEWGVPAGDVVYTKPGTGRPVGPGSTVDVYVNPDPMSDPTQTGEADDRSCDLSTPDYVPQASQTPNGFTQVSDPTLVESSTFSTSLGPTVMNYGYAEAVVGDELDFSGWGYWHILAGHGWSLADDAATRLALEDPTPVPSTMENSYVFYGPRYPGTGGAICRRIVVVAFGTTTGDPGPKGIITSYGADVTTLRAGEQ